MLDKAHHQGVQAALAHFGVKTSGIRDWVSGAGKMFLGQPGKVFTEGAHAFSPGGMLSHENIWWPKTQGLTGAQKILPWMQRASTAMIPLQMMHAARQNPDEGTLSNVLGTAGSIAGTAYGFPALGMLGGPMLGQLGSRVGHGVGHLLGSKPHAPELPQTQYPPQDPYQ
jgi:hypothetical protein